MHADSTHGPTGDGDRTMNTPSNPERMGKDGVPGGRDDTTAVFMISVAAELAGMHAQTLRTYDRLGLVTLHRTSGGGRRYSSRDVELLREIQRLSQEERGQSRGHQTDHRLEQSGRRPARAGRRAPPRNWTGRGRVAVVNWSRCRARARWWCGKPRRRRSDGQGRSEGQGRSSEGQQRPSDA